MTKSKWIWMNGKLVAHDDATVHVGSPTVHFGPAVFEGIRCYELEDGRSNFFRLRAHIERLYASAHTFKLEIPASPAQLEEACIATVLANGRRDAYVRPVAFPGATALGFGRAGSTEICVLSFPWDATHLTRSQRQGIRVGISGVIRCEPRPGMSKAKVSANYAAGLLAIHEARAAGFDDTLLLDADGAVAEASTSNVFAVWGGQLVTPPGDLPILLGITRGALIVLAKELGLDVVERRFTARELGSADEVFISGTTSEVTPVREVDGKTIGDGKPGKVTLDLLAALHTAIRGEGSHREWTHWLKG